MLIFAPQTMGSLCIHVTGFLEKCQTRRHVPNSTPSIGRTVARRTAQKLPAVIGAGSMYAYKKLTQYRVVYHTINSHIIALSI